MNNLFASFDWNLILNAKIFLIPLILGVIFLVEKKWGAVLGGALSGLPLVSGTLMCFSVFHQTPQDYTQSLYGAIEGVVALSLMVFAYSKMTYAISGGYDRRLSGKERGSILLKSLLIYIVISALFSSIQGKLNHLISSNIAIPFIFIAVCAVLNFFLYKNLPKIKPDENKVNFKFKNSIYMMLIGTITFSVFSSIKTYGSAASLIGLISTAPFYLSIVIFMTHKVSTDYDLLHLNQGILMGFFGYLLFFSVFIIGLPTLQLSPEVVVPTAILLTIGSYFIYAIKFSKKNKHEVTKISQENITPMMPAEESLSDISLDSLKDDLLLADIKDQPIEKSV